jgi:hypothetical protein
MKSFLAAVIAVIAMSIGASILLERFQHTSETAYTGPGVRIDTDHPPAGAPKG